MADKLMYIPNILHEIIPSVDYNLWLKRLHTQLNESMNQDLIKVPKVVKTQQIRKHYYKTLGTSAINSPMSHSALL